MPNSTTHPIRHPAREDQSNAIRAHLALALIGRTVDVLANARTVAHGVVTGVLTEAGRAKVVVGGAEYDMNQLLTVTPAFLN